MSAVDATPRDAVLRYLADRERIAGRDRPEERAEAILALTDAMAAARMPRAEAHSMARVREGAMEDGSISIERMRAGVAHLARGYRRD